jgi:hypothetical protein
MSCATSTKIEPDSRGLVPAIHASAVQLARKEDVDARDKRDKRGHDSKRLIRLQSHTL